jgi:hypothetical protein
MARRLSEWWAEGTTHSLSFCAWWQMALHLLWSHKHRHMGTLQTTFNSYYLGAVFFRYLWKVSVWSNSTHSCTVIVSLTAFVTLLASFDILSACQFSFQFLLENYFFPEFVILLKKKNHKRALHIGEMSMFLAFPVWKFHTNHSLIAKKSLLGPCHKFRIIFWIGRRHQHISKL